MTTAMYQASLGVTPWDTATVSDFDANFNATMLDMALVSQTGLDKSQLEAVNKYVTTLYAAYQASLGVTPWNTTAISDYDATFNATMLDAALSEGTGMETLQALNKYITALIAIYQDTLGLTPLDLNSVSDNDATFNTTLETIYAMSSANIMGNVLPGDAGYEEMIIADVFTQMQSVLTSGLVDGVVDATEDYLVDQGEQPGVCSGCSDPQGTEAYTDCCVDAVLTNVFFVPQGTAGLGGKDSAGYITYLFDTGMQGQYGVSNDFFGLAQEYNYVTNQTYDSNDQNVYHFILVDLGLNQVGYPTQGAMTTAEYQSAMIAIATTTYGQTAYVVVFERAKNSIISLLSRFHHVTQITKTITRIVHS